MFPATLRDRKGLGNAAVYVRARSGLMQYWDFTALTWIPNETIDTKVYLVEYPDSDTLESRYAVHIALPPGSDVRLEYAHVSDDSVVAEESPGELAASSIASTLVDILNRLQRVLALLYDNAVIDQQTYNVNSQLLTARVRSYDSADNATLAGDQGLLFTYHITAGYDTTGRLISFRELSP